ncbi:hypothetical protein PQX77_018856 [Marasmius sp. AFHP31]|nr:hypothetical protein PQX77_018856 [Marasmius sp. AFHP31]
MAEWAHYSEIDPELAPLVDALPALPVNLPVEQIRGFYNTATEQRRSKSESSLPPSSEYIVTEHEIAVGGGVTVLARSIVPTPRDGEDGAFPLLFWIHGGGFILGDRNMDDYWLRTASVEVRISVVNCEYRLAPEHPYPTAVDDCFAALKFVASSPEKFSASLKKGFLVGGTSAGGRLTAVISHLARDDPFFNDEPVTGQLLHIPGVVHHSVVPEKYKSLYRSIEQNKDAPILSRSGMDHFYAMYKPVPTDTKYSPLLLETHKDLPPAYLQVCGLDPLRDDGLIYEKVLREAGVPTKLEVSTIAQQFSTPSTWRKPNMTISAQERIQHASDTLKATMRIFDDDSGQFTNTSTTHWGTSGQLFMSMAEFDVATNGTQYRDKLLSYFPKAEVIQRGFLNHLIYGIAAAKAYAAYKDSAFLSWAETSWNSARPFVISDNDVQSGKALGKSTVIRESCSGASLAGGGFWASRLHTATSMVIDVVTSSCQEINASIPTLSARPTG